MKVTIQNFRCFRKETTYVFEKNRLTLLKGQSGAGKSTLLESIRWCLFGNLRNIYPSGFTPTPTNKTFVTVEINNLRITRSQSPEQLKVDVIGVSTETKPASPTRSLIQEMAQEYIDSVFGNRNVWLASSFIHQNERCPLMIASNSERMTLLNEILFGNDNSTPFENPDYYIEKIEEEAEKISKEITGQTAVFNTWYTKYTNGIAGYQNVYGWTGMSQEQIDEYIKGVESFKIAISQKSSELLSISSMENKKEILKNKLDSMSDIREVSQNEIDVILTQINDISSIMTKAIMNKTKYNSLTEQLQQQILSLNPEFLKHSISKLEEDIEVSKNYISDTELKLNKVRTLEFSKQQLISSIESTTSSYNLNEEKLKSYNCLDINKLNSILQNSLVYIRIQEIIEKMKVIKIEETVEESKIEETRKNLQTSLMNTKYNESICNKYNLEIRNIVSEVEKAKEIIEFDKVQKVHLQNYRLYTNINSELEKLKLVDVQEKDNIASISLRLSSIVSDINSLNEVYIKNLIDTTQQRLGSPLKCPHCDCTVEYFNGQLLVPKSEIISRDEGLKTISSLNELLDKIIKNNSTQKLIDSYKSKLEMVESFDKSYIESKVYSDTEILNLKNLIDDCQRIQIDSAQTESNSDLIQKINSKLNNLQNLEDYYKYQKEYTDLASQFNATVSIETDLNKLRNDIATLPLLVSTSEKLKTQLESMNLSLNDIIKSIGEEKSETLSLILDSKKVELKNLESLCSKTKIAFNTQSIIDNLQSQILLLNVSEFESNNITKLENQKLDLQKNLQELQRCFSSYKEYSVVKKEYDSIVLTTSSVLLTQEVEELKINLEKYSSMLDLAQKFLILVNDRKELETIQSKMMDLTNKQTSLNTLKSVITDVTNCALQNLVDSINNTMNVILEDLFDNGIVVELKLYKEIKTKHKVRAQVNLTIYNGGNIYDSINCLSGGEKDRISLAMTLALATIHTSPIVFLDECMGSLDSELKDDCIEVIKKVLNEQNNKTVIDIEHAISMGFYDNVVEIVK